MPGRAQEATSRTAAAERRDGPGSLVEAILFPPELRDAVTAALEGLAVRVGSPEAICLVADRERGQLFAMGSYPAAAADLEAFTLSLEDEAHPLVVALHRGEPLVVSGPDQSQLRDVRGPPLPLGPGPVHVMPLQLPSAPHALGAIVYRSPSRGVDQEARDAGLLLAARLLREEQQRSRTSQTQTTQERDLLRRVVDAVTDPILAIDSDGRILVANSRAERLFAAEGAESEGRRHAVALNNMIFSAACFTTVGRRRAAPRELPVVDPVDGADMLFELLLTPFSDRQVGSGAVSVLRDVGDLREATEELKSSYTRMREAEAAVRAERDRLELILGSVADPVVVTTPEGGVELMNPPAERLFTGPAEGDAAVAKRVASNDVLFSSFISNVFTHGSAGWRGELSLLDPQNGETVPFDAVSGVVLDKRGEASAVVTILHDRSEAVENAYLYEQVKRQSQRLEQEVQAATMELLSRNELLRRQAVELQEASRLKSQFLANMSHELRTPLHAILGYTQLLLDEGLGPIAPEQRKRLGRVESNAQHLLSIINDILDIARIEAGKMPLEVEGFSIDDLVDEVMAELEPLIARAPVGVTSRLDSTVPPVESDRQKVKQILMNLLSNALKFTHEGAILVGVEHDTRRDEVAISVADTGIGIAEEDQALIFQDFQQADSSPTRRFGGTGLGLAICRRLATSLGARISLESAPGFGSRFTLHLPRTTLQREAR